MRRSDGGVPYGNQNDPVQLGYRFFVLKKAQIPDDLNLDSYEEVERFVIQNPEAIEFVSNAEIR
ncbi:MAG: hypothetical protein EA392_03525 [Cryomorphaceae bacterium]|nr:MAG: hypothetical protein EA392_03525 [Cryomorphaceae bacterium]